MSSALLGEDELRDMVQERISSREWWIIPMASDMGLRMAEGIETSFYMDEASADFETITGGFGGCLLASLAFGRKTRMSTADLSRVLRVDLPEDGRDVLGTTDIPIPFVEWLETFHWSDAGLN